MPARGTGDGFGGEIAARRGHGIDAFQRVVAVNVRRAPPLTEYAARTMIRLGRGGALSSGCRSGAGRRPEEIGAPLVFRPSDGASVIPGVSPPIDGRYPSR